MLVACTVTENFLPCASAMLHSLLTAGADESVDVVVLHDGPLSDVGRARVQETVALAGGSLRFVGVPEARICQFPPGPFPRAIWARVLLPELLPNEDKALYLDADTLVLESPADLWSTALSGASLAAVANPLYPFMNNEPCRALGIADPRRYFNSGVLLMDLERLRRDGAAKRLLDSARAHPGSLYPDQDALNSCFSWSHVSLHPRWNAQASLWDLRFDRLPFSVEEVREARARPAIVHFNGPFKPWHYLCSHPNRDRYFEHLAATPWPMPQPEGRTVVNRVVRRLPADVTYRWIRARARLRDRVRYRLAGRGWRRS